MTTEDILTFVAEEQPEMMAKIAGVIKETEKECPDFVPGIFKDFQTICEVTTEKLAAAPSAFGKAVNVAKKVITSKPAVAVGGALALGLTSALSTDLYDAAKRSLTKGRNFKRIMDANPSFKRDLDKKQMMMAFDALHRYAPDFTADPLVGGALLKQLSELPQMSHKTIMELIGSRKDLLDAKGRHFGDMSKMTTHLMPEPAREEVTQEIKDGAWEFKTRKVTHTHR